MTEPTTTATESAEGAVNTDWQAKYETTKAHMRTWESRAKEGEAAKAELDRIKADKLTAEERIAQERLTSQQELAEARAEALRYKIAAKHAISDEDAGIFLTGMDEETLTRQAKRLSELSKVETGEPVTAPGPRADLSQGPKGTPLALNGDPLEQMIKDKLGI